LFCIFSNVQQCLFCLLLPSFCVRLWTSSTVVWLSRPPTVSVRRFTFPSMRSPRTPSRTPSPWTTPQQLKPGLTTAMWIWLKLQITGALLWRRMPTEPARVVPSPRPTSPSRESPSAPPSTWRLSKTPTSTPRSWCIMEMPCHSRRTLVPSPAPNLRWILTSCASSKESCTSASSSARPLVQTTPVRGPSLVAFSMEA